MWPCQATEGPDVTLPGQSSACCGLTRPQRCADGRTDGRTDGRRADGRTPGGRRAVRESLWPRVSTHTRTPKIATPPLRGENSNGNMWCQTVRQSAEQPPACTSPMVSSRAPPNRLDLAWIQPKMAQSGVSDRQSGAKFAQESSWMGPGAKNFHEMSKNPENLQLYRP